MTRPTAAGRARFRSNGTRPDCRVRKVRQDHRAPRGRKAPQGPQGVQGPAGASGTSQVYSTTGGHAFGATSEQIVKLSVPAGSYLVTATGTVANESDDSTQDCDLTTDATAALQSESVDTFHFSTGSDRNSSAESMALSGTFTTPTGNTGIYVFCRSSDSTTTADHGLGEFNLEALKVDSIN